MNHAYAESTVPIIQLWGVLVVPVQGDVSDSQAGRLRDAILERIRKTAAQVLVIDVSGVAVLDSHLCSLLTDIAAAARLMGLASVVCGLGPEIVMTLQAMGIELGDVETAPTLEIALERFGCLERLRSPVESVPSEYDDAPES